MENTALAKVEEGPKGLAKIEDGGISIEEIVARVEKIRAVAARVMKKDQHFGVIPGTPKPTLLKPGAELLCMTFQLAPSFHLDERYTETPTNVHLEIVATCTLTHAPSGTVVGSAIGSCSTRESKYAYRKGERVCPECGKGAIIKGKAEYGGGYVCFKKKGGCGAKYKDDDTTITEQNTDRIANPDIADQYNTVRKMACKRAHVAAVLFVTCASELFTQDVEDMAQFGGNGDERSAGNAQGQASPYDEIRRVLDNVELQISTARDYDAVLIARGLLGMKDGSIKTDLTRAIQAGRDQKTLSPVQFKEIGKIWNRLDRQLAKLEAQHRPPAEASFMDGDDESESAEDTDEPEDRPDIM